MIDVRSDTVTKPTRQMLDAMICAQVGDDILGDDPSVKELEALGASMFQKEAALFVVSGTMANQLAVMTHTNRGDEVIVGSDSHIYNLEVGALAALSQVQARPVECVEGRPDPAVFERAIQEAGIQRTHTGLICLENTYDLNRGYPVPREEMELIVNLAANYGVPVYLDGARIFNAASALGTTVEELTRPVATLQVCLTKGLCAPFGSLLIGDGAFIEKARWLRQRIGGGMRQAGYMAAAAAVALRTMPEQIGRDNWNARLLAERIAARIPEIISPHTVKSNIINLDLAQSRVDTEEFYQAVLEKDVLIKPLGGAHFRMICHYGIGEPEMDQIVDAIVYAVAKARIHGILT